MPTPSPAVSIVVPTYHEAANIQSLVERTFQATHAARIEAELILVDDDSRDETAAIVEELQKNHPVRLVVRKGERGLSSAVLRGFQEAKHDRFLVLDADLQHPPEMIPVLLARLDQGDCDFVLGSRYLGEGGVDADWPILRRITSRIATVLARPLVPLSDPMTGFFALHRQTWERAERLNPIGYKIALELYVKGRCRRPAEVPIRFAARAAGESKLSFAEHWRYLRHLARLYSFRFPRFSLFLALFILGIVAMVCLWLIRATRGVG